MSSQLATCTGCGARGLTERIQDHACQNKPESGVTTHYGDGTIRLVGSSGNEWLAMDVSMEVAQ